MDIRQLRYFVEVLDAGSLRKGADRLHIAQTALGRQVKLLEEEFDTKLVERLPRGITPTVDGQRLERLARKLLAQVDEIHLEMQSKGQRIAGHGTIGAPAAIAQFVFGPVAERIAREHPEIGLSFVEGNGNEIFAGLEARDIDIAILIAPERQDGFEYEGLLEEPMFLVSRIEDTRVPDGPVTVEEVSHLPLTAFRPGSEARKIFNRAMVRANIVPNIAYELGHPLLALDFISRGLAYGLMSAAQLASVSPGKAFRHTLIQSLSVDRTLVRRTRSSNKMVEDTLTECVRDEFRNIRATMSVDPTLPDRDFVGPTPPSPAQAEEIRPANCPEGAEDTP